MSDEQKKRTRQEIVLLREGYVQALVGWASTSPDYARSRAAEVFPYPKRTVPNVVRDDDGVEWYVEDGNLRSRGDRSGLWSRTVVWGPSALAAIKEVLNNPTKEIEDDGTDGDQPA